MSIGGFVRRTLYYTNDFLYNNGRNYKLFKEIKEINNSSRSIGMPKISLKLDALLKHACKTTEFYSQFNGIKLEEFPVINKNTIIENREKMQSNIFKGKKLHEMHTSGSTGIPFVIQQDMRKRAHVIAELKASSDEAGYKSHEKMMYILGSTHVRPYSAKQEFCENIYRISVSVNDEFTMKKMVDFLIKKKPVAIHASASSLPPLINYIKKSNISSRLFKVRTVITGGEMVPVGLRENIQNVFGPKCKVIVKYASEELGILAQDSGINTPYKLNVANYHFEILQLNSDKPCNLGESGRIVITDLYNYALPLIRYDTGDIGTLIEQSSDSWPVLVDLNGKRRDLIFDTLGNSISGATITSLLKYIKNVRQYQLVQEAEKTYVLKVIVDKGIIPTNEDLMISELKNLLGQDADVRSEIIDEVITTRSGKTRYTVNLYKPQ